MRNIVRSAGLAIAAGVFASAASVAQPVASPERDIRQLPIAPLDPVVRLRLSERLGDALPEVMAGLAGLKAVRIAEPADFELTTEPDFPQTLLALDAKQPEKLWQTNFSEDPPRRHPRRYELGNLVLDDFGAPMRELVERRARVNRLLVLPITAPPNIETCIVPYFERPVPGNCHRGGMRAADVGRPSPDEIDVELMTPAVTVANKGAKPLYTALLLIDPSLGIERVPLEGDAASGLLAPGGSGKSDFLSALATGRYFLITILSDQPIDTRDFEQPSLVGGQWSNCRNPERQEACGRPMSPIPSNWLISSSEFWFDGPILVGLGGGMSVLDGMAPWMAEVYSTVPYEKKDFVEDAAKPPSEREFLAQRRPAELSHRCGGSMIAPDLVLTAAHCVAKGHYAGNGMSRVFSERRVRVGTVRLGRGGTTLAIAGVAVPANYVGGRQENDIALLLVRPDRDTKLRSTATIRLGEKPLAAETRLTAFGWGYTGEVAPDSNPLFNVAEELQRNPDMLQFGQMKVLGWQACRKRLGSRLGQGMTCLVAPGATATSTPADNVFSCRGDSGGPLVRKIGGVEELVGVTSWSMGCGYKDVPSVYTDVTKYRRWIEAARKQLRPGLAIRVDEKTARPRQEARRQAN